MIYTYTWMITRFNLFAPGVVLRVPATQPCHPAALAAATDFRA